MNIININQNTDEWLEWRNTGLGASDAATILGKNPYQTAFDLWEIMTNRKKPLDLSNNPNVQRGNELEPLARASAEKFLKMKLDVLCATESNDPYVMASFDGINLDNEIVCELKCPHETTFLDVASKKRKSAFYLVYWIQVQQQLYVSKAKKAYLIFFLKGEKGEKNKLLPFEILPDIEFQQNELVPALKSFWYMVKNNVEPPRDVIRDRCIINESFWRSVANPFADKNLRLTELTKESNALKTELEPLKALMISLMGQNHLAESNGVRVKKFPKKGKVKYDQLITDLLAKLKQQGFDIDKGVLLDRYREEQSFQHRFTSGDEINSEQAVSLETDFIL